MYEHPEINLLRPENQIGYEPLKKHRRKFFVFLIFFALLVFFGARFISTYGARLPSAEPPTFLGRLKSVFAMERRLEGEGSGRVNILLLGIGGPGHDGPYLTDTIILASIRPKEGELALISIPRDLLAEIPGVGARKINEADAFGELKEAGAGGEAVRKALSGVLKMDIPYYARVDFSGFRKIVNDLGGVMIDAPQTFTDYFYPTMDYGYQTIGFAAGKQLMSGERALQFVRSRHGTNGEGSDFARSRRQQLLMAAMKDRIFSLSTLANPAKIGNLISDLDEHLKTNIGIWETARLANLARNLDYDNIRRLVLSEGESEPLVSEMRDGAYVLVPRSGDWGEVRGLVENVFAAPPTAKKNSAETQKKILVEVQNGTKTAGLAYKTSLKLLQMGFDIVNVKNAARRDFMKTVIYDMSGGKYKEPLVELRKSLDANVGISVPTWLKETVGGSVKNPDFVVIIGESAS